MQVAEWWLWQMKAYSNNGAQSHRGHCCAHSHQRHYFYHRFQGLPCVCIIISLSLGQTEYSSHGSCRNCLLFPGIRPFPPTAVSITPCTSPRGHSFLDLLLGNDSRALRHSLCSVASRCLRATEHGWDCGGIQPTVGRHEMWWRVVPWC